MSLKKLGAANKAESKPIAQGLINTRYWGFEPYLTVNILSGKLPAIPATAVCSRAVGHDIQIFESRDRKLALIYSAASFKPIQSANSSFPAPCYLLRKEL